MEQLSDIEVQQLIMSRMRAAERRGDEGASREELERVVEWAEGVRADNGLLANVLSGNLLMAGFNEEGEPIFSLSDSGAGE